MLVVEGAAMTTSDKIPDESEFRITRMRVKNYRSIRNLDMELGPLTVLVGPNASGKSNILDALRFIRDAVARGVDFAISQRDGMDSIRHRHRPGQGRRRDVELGVSATFRGVALDYNFVLRRDSSGGHRVMREYGSYKLGKESEPVEFDIRDGRVMNSQGIPDLGILPGQLSFFRYAHFFFEEKLEGSDRQISPAILHYWAMIGALADLRFSHVFPHVIRDPHKQTSAERLDEHGDNLASVLREMEKREEGFEDLKETLSHALPGVTNLRSRAVGGYIVLQFEHSNIHGDERIWLDAAQESDGTLRILGLLTAIHQPLRPPLLGIEEPEWAIHPGVLPVLADEFQEASLRMQVMITTHSPDFIDRFPVECIRAVEFVDGETRVGKVSETQVEAVKRGLFTSGEIHRMEGLRTAKE